jgi:hypothetical protein
MAHLVKHFRLVHDTALFVRSAELVMEQHPAVLYRGRFSRIICIQLNPVDATEALTLFEVVDGEDAGRARGEHLCRLC